MHDKQVGENGRPPPWHVAAGMIVQFARCVIHSSRYLPSFRSLHSCTRISFHPGCQQRHTRCSVSTYPWHRRVPPRSLQGGQAASRVLGLARKTSALATMLTTTLIPAWTRVTTTTSPRIAAIQPRDARTWPRCALQLAAPFPRASAALSASNVAICGVSRNTASRVYIVSRTAAVTSPSAAAITVPGLSSRLIVASRSSWLKLFQLAMHPSSRRAAVDRCIVWRSPGM